MNNDIQSVSNIPMTPLARATKSTQKLNTSDNIEQFAKKISAENPSNQGKEKVASSKVTSLDDARKLAKEGNKILDQVAQRDLQFKVDEATNKVVMSIVDKKTGDVIRQIPSEDVLKLAKRLQDSENSKGSIVQYKA